MSWPYISSLEAETGEEAAAEEEEAAAAAGEERSCQMLTIGDCSGSLLMTDCLLTNLEPLLILLNANVQKCAQPV